MTEPVSSTAAAGSAIGWGKITAILTHPATLAAIMSGIVFMMTTPKTKTQQIVAFASTFLGSIFGGGFLIDYYHLEALGTYGKGAIYLAAGVPVWVILRGFFAYTERDKSKGLLDYIKEVRSAWKSE